MVFLIITYLREVNMDKQYVVWWHNYVYDISREATTIDEIYKSVSNTLKEISKLKILEKEGKIKVKHSKTLNPLYIEILDKSAEKELQANPIVDLLEK